MKPSMPTIIRADARAMPLPDESVDLIVTSPPYFGLRSYTDGGQHYDGQIGAEPTPREFIAALVDCTREWMRVLKPSGSLFVNLGDKYNSAASGQQNGHGHKSGLGGGRHDRMMGRGATVQALPQKSLMLLPERYRIACVDELGLVTRAVIIWSKPNGLPESVTDRVRRSHEDWVHLTKSPRYFSAVDEIREPHISNVTPGRRHGGAAFGAIKNGGGDGSRHTDGHPLGKLPGSVWEIATQPLRVPVELGVDHFAAFPMEWPRRLILGWSPREVCTACGEARRWVTQPSAEFVIASGLTGYEDCACLDTTAPSTPGVVLDPFGGTGTTSLVATMLGRHGISVDLSADYCRLAEWRAADPKERARAAGLDPDDVAKVKQQLPGQFDLFGEAS
jgi:site-specific DNA-methyltransferase (cytosine-N4-specific)